MEMKVHTTHRSKLFKKHLLIYIKKIPAALMVCLLFFLNVDQSKLYKKHLTTYLKKKKNPAALMVCFSF